MGVSRGGGSRSRTSGPQQFRKTFKFDKVRIGSKSLFKPLSGRVKDIATNTGQTFFSNQLETDAQGFTTGSFTVTGTEGFLSKYERDFARIERDEDDRFQRLELNRLGGRRSSQVNQNTSARLRTLRGRAQPRSLLGGGSERGRV